MKFTTGVFPVTTTNMIISVALVLCRAQANLTTAEYDDEMTRNMNEGRYEFSCF